MNKWLNLKNSQYDSIFFLNPATRKFKGKSKVSYLSQIGDIIESFQINIHKIGMRRKQKEIYEGIIWYTPLIHPDGENPLLCKSALAPKVEKL